MLLRLRAYTAVITMITTITRNSSTIPPIAPPMMIYCVEIDCWTIDPVVGDTGGVGGSMSEEKQPWINMYM